MDGYEVEPEELTAAAARITTAVAPVDGIGLGIGNGAAYGLGDVAGAVTRFCGTWQVALDVLAERGHGAAGTLVATAGAYVATDDTARRSMSDPATGGD